MLSTKVTLVKSLDNMTILDAYTLNGKQLGKAIAVDGTATYTLNGTGDIVIAKFGGKSIKIVTK